MPGNSSEWPGKGKRDKPASRPFTTTAAVAARMRELGYTAAELADRAGVSYLTVKYFGLLPHDQDTLERLSVALGWPPGNLRELWEGVPPHDRPTATEMS
jgi:hypothetical protein